MARGRDLAWLILAALAAATSTPLAKVAQGMPAPALAAARTGIAAAVLLLAFPRATLRSIARLTWRQRGALALSGALLATHFVLFLAGVAATSVPAASALVATEPLAVVVVAWLVFRIAPRAHEPVGLALAVVGGAIVAAGAGEGEHRLIGDLLVLAAVFFYAFYVAVARALKDALPPGPYAASVYAIAALLLSPFTIASLASAPPIAPRAFVAAVGLALVPTLIGHTLIQRLARTSTPTVVALVSPGEAVGSIAIGVVALGAWPSARVAIGAAVVIVGTLIALGVRVPRRTRAVTEVSGGGDRGHR